MIQQDEINDSLWVLMPRQRARIHALDASGQALQSTGAEGPNYFGEVALRAQMPADSTVEAEADSQWLRLHARDLEAFSHHEGEDLRPKLALRTDIGLLLEREGARRHHTWLQPGEFIDLFRRRHWLVLLRKTWPTQTALLADLCAGGHALLSHGTPQRLAGLALVGDWVDRGWAVGVGFARLL